MEIKFELDMEKAAKAIITITASYRLRQVSKGTEYPQLAFANSIILIAIIAILYGPNLAPKAKEANMTPDAITRLFKEAYDAFPPLEGKLSDDDLLAIRETLLPLVMVIPYNQLNGVHSFTAILAEAVKYKADHGAKFVCLACLPLYNKMTADDATTVIHVHAKAAHKSQLDDYASYKAAE
jgi:hypothetical protein